MLIGIRKAGLEVPKQSQLYNYIKNNRKEKLGSTVIFLNDLKDWANSRMDIPVEEDKMFVESAVIIQANQMQILQERNANHILNVKRNCNGKNSTT